MPQVVREDVDNLNAVLTVTVAKSDYESKFNEQLAKYKQQAHLKGFRKGKTPKSVIRKMFGRSILADVINEELQKELFDYIRAEDLNLLGQPIPAESQEPIDFDAKALEDYTFKFDIGLAPDFEVQGLDESNSFEKYKVNPSDEMIDEELENARKRLGEVVKSDGPIGEGDMVKFKGQELLFGVPKAEGVTAEFSVTMDRVQEEAKKTLLAAKVGETLDLDLTSLEENVDAEFVRKYYLKVEEGEEVDMNFRLEILEATHVENAEMNEAFFQKLFNNDEITTEEQARAEIKENISKYYDSQADALLFRDFQDDLLEKNQISLPNDFLKKWIMTSNENATEEAVAREYDAFAKNLQWSLINEKIVKMAEIEITEEDIKGGLRKRVQGYLQGNPNMMGDEFLDMMVGRLMSDEQQVNQVRDEVMSEKIHDAIAEKVSITDKPIALDDFIKVLQEAQEQANQARAGVAASEEE